MVIKTNIIITMTNNGIGRKEKVNKTCLDGLEILKKHNLVFLAKPANDIFSDHSYGNGELAEFGNNADIGTESIESSSTLTSSWSDKVRFDDDGYVTSLDLGGRRLHRGLELDPAVLGPEYFPRLTTLSLAGTDIPLNDVLVIIPHIDSTIECLFLGGNALGTPGAKAIAASSLFRPETRSKLIKLDLRYNDIDGDGMAAISKALMDKTNALISSIHDESTNATTHLQYLYLEGNNIGDSGCRALSELLSLQSKKEIDSNKPYSSSCRIQELFIGANGIGPAGAEHIASALGVNKTISKIYLEGNAMGEQGAIAFCRVLEELKGNTGLKHLYVDNNNIGKELSNRLAKALRSDTVIDDICANSNPDTTR